MKTWISIKGTAYAVCSEEIETEIRNANTVENLFNGLYYQGDIKKIKKLTLSTYKTYKTL